LSRIALAIRSFFGILFGGSLPADVAQHFGFVKREPAKKPAAPAKEWRPADGALQILGILQRDSRLVDFLMEDISGYADDQVGAAVRNLHQSCRQALERYVKLSPVIDGVEGTFAKADSAGALANDAAAVKFIGNVPASGKASSGTLRHKGWRAEKIELPALAGGANPAILAPAEIEIE